MQHTHSYEDTINSFYQYNPRLLHYFEVYYTVHKSPPLVPILIQMNRADTLSSYFFKIHFNIIIPSIHNIRSGLLPTSVLLFKYSVHKFYSWYEQDFSLLHVVQTGPGVQLPSYPMGTGGSFPGG
jgi:hypothetical protein